MGPLIFDLIYYTDSDLTEVNLKQKLSCCLHKRPNGNEVASPLQGSLCPATWLSAFAQLMSCCACPKTLPG